MARLIEQIGRGVFSMRPGHVSPYVLIAISVTGLAYIALNAAR